MEIKKRIEELTNDLLRYQEAYYVQGKSLISDSEYDGLFDELARLEREHPEYASPNSPTVRVGSDLTSDFPEVKHTIPVLSLDKAYSVEEVLAFMAKCEEKGKENLSFVRMGDSADSFHNLCTSCTDQTGKTYDLTCMDIKGNIFKETGAGKMLDTKLFFSDFYLWFREQVVDLTSNHSFDQICIGNSIYIVSSDILGITEYGNSGSQTVHIFKSVRNKDNGNALFFQLVYDPAVAFWLAICTKAVF